MFLLDKFSLKENKQISLTPKRYVFKQNDEFKGIYIITKGKIKLTRKNNKNKKVAVWFAGHGEIIGMTSYFEKTGKHSFGALCIEPSEMVYVPKQQFEELIKTNKKFKKELINILCERISYTEDRINNINKHNLKERLIKSLIFHIKKSPESKEFKFHVKDVAEIVGSSLQYLQKYYLDLQKNNLIKLNGDYIEVTNPKKLYNQLQLQ